MAERRHLKETFLVLRTALLDIERELTFKLTQNYDNFMNNTRSDYQQLEMAYERAKQEFTKQDLDLRPKNDQDKGAQSLELLVSKYPIVQKVRDSDYKSIYDSTQEEVLVQVEEIDEFLASRKKKIGNKSGMYVRDTNLLVKKERVSNLGTGNHYSSIAEMFDRPRPRTGSVHSSNKKMERKSMNNFSHATFGKTPSNFNR